MIKAEKIKELDSRLAELRLEIFDYRQIRSSVVLARQVHSRDAVVRVAAYIDNEIYAIQVRVSMCEHLKLEYATAETATKEKEITGVLYIDGKAV